MASDRYATRPPVVVSPDLSAPWVMQLGRKPGQVLAARNARRRRSRAAARAHRGRRRPTRSAPRRSGAGRSARSSRRSNPIYLPQQVAYDGPHKPGTIIIDTAQKFLYLVEPDGKARRYGVGTGKPGFEWAGTHKHHAQGGMAGLAPARAR